MGLRWAVRHCRVLGPVHPSTTDTRVRRRGTGVVCAPVAEGRVQGLAAPHSRAPIGPLVGCLPLVARVQPLLLRLPRLPLPLEWAIVGQMAIEPIAEARP